MAVDADTIKFLEDVKKGKPRRFAMICKGVKIVSLVVYKKGTVEKYKKIAKEEGKGQFYHGVVDGKGVNIAFKLLRSDGFDKPPGKELILKDFLASEADMKFKPVYEIVDELPEIEDLELGEMEGEENGVPPIAPPPPPPKSKSTETVPPPPPPPPGASDEKTFTSRLQALLPELKKAQSVETSVSQDLKLRASEAQVFARKKDFNQANRVLDQLEALIEKALAESKSQTVPPAPPPPPKSDANAAFDKLWPAIKKSWQNASETIDTQISQLQSKLKESDDADLKEIAEFGLNGVTGGHKVPLMAAIRDVDSTNGDGRAKAVAKLSALVADFQSFLKSDETVMACDENPFGVKVSIRDTLGGALTSMDKALQAIAKG